MTTTTLTLNSIAVTGLPEGIVPSLEFKDRISFDYRDENSGMLMPDYIMLPPGKWRILNFSQSMTEEQWEDIVLRKSIYSGLVMFKYMDYNEPKGFRLDNALLSGHSLLKSKDLDPLLNHLILINDENTISKTT